MTTYGIRRNWNGRWRLLESRPEVGVCGTSIHKFGDIDAVHLFPEDSDALKVGLLFYCMMSHPSVVYRRSMLVETGLSYRQEYFPAEDYKMWVEVLQHSHIHNLQQPLVEYRQHGGQICRKNNCVWSILIRPTRNSNSISTASPRFNRIPTRKWNNSAAGRKNYARSTKNMVT